MENNPLVSIVLPIRNDSPEFIEECLSSIKNQTYNNIEVILIDDSDNINTINTIDRQKGLNFLIVREPNRKKGLPSALNRGIELSSGDFIARADADDIQNENRIEKQVKFLMENSDIDVVGCNNIIIDDSNNIIGKSVFKEENASMMRSMSISTPLSHPSVMVKRRFFEIVGKYNENLKRAEDYDLWLRARKIKGIKFYNIQENLVYYRISNIEKRDSLHWFTNLQLKLKYFIPKYFISSVSGIIIVSLFLITPNFLKIKIYKKYKTW